MHFSKKLHIKLLSVALLVTLVSFNGLENHVLPQQFTLEYVVAYKLTEVCAVFLKVQATENLCTYRFNTYDFQEYLNAYNARQFSGFKMMSFKKNSLKKTQQEASFLMQSITSSKNVHASLI